ncbi:MAG: site-2 protease family protein [Rubripirellula sp.]
MAKRDLSTIDLGQQKLRLAEDVMVWPVRECGELVYRFEIPSQHRFFRVGYSEYVLISMLDGKTTLPEACGLAAARLGPDAPTAAQASTIARWLIDHQLACLENEANPSRSESFDASAYESSQSGHARKTLLKGLNPFWLKVPFPKSGNWVPRIAEKLKPLCSIYVVSCSLLVCCIAAWQFAVNSELFLSTSVEVFHRSNWAYLLLTWVVLKLVHELAHAVVCAQTGSEVSEAGLVFVLFAPLAYVNVTSCWRLSDRWKRIAVASAGMYVELLIAAVAFLFWLNVSDIHTRFLLDNIVWMAGVSTLLFNLNVLMRFDGYYILADLVEVPNLYGEAMQAVKSVFLRLVVGQASEPSRLRGWRRTFVLAYGFAALAWRIFICVSLMIAVWNLFLVCGSRPTVLQLLDDTMAIRARACCASDSSFGSRLRCCFDRAVRGSLSNGYHSARYR